ncbi:PBP1A family penicillin-binding protein [Pseudogracilibacillus sp. SE30717A]|uniref:transglycosylase domain-containing protein n=1 Tax=Pseudogracilibacillus sp. SE30717A TaxID=3098293 RepID=UPI00300E056F
MATLKATWGDYMDSNQQDRRRRKRSDRHLNKQESKKNKFKNLKDNMLLKWKSIFRKDEPNEVIIEEKLSEPKQQKSRRSDQNSTDSSGKRTKSGEKKGFPFSIKYTILSLGSVFVLALIAYTIILYGGKLFVDQDKLIISPPTTIETEDGEIIWYLYDQYRLPVDLEQVPDHVQDAFIAIEDKRFYTHSGVDFRSIMRALYKDIIARSKVEGASTITQQLAKNLFLTNDKSWLRKTKEVMIALYLEREFTKDEILEMYLNAVYFGEGQYGIEAASNKYFYKSVEDLTLEEGALLAGMVKAPNGYSPIEHEEKAKNRRNVVLNSMSELEYITPEEAKTAQEKEIQLNIAQRKINPAYHTFVDLAIKEAADLYGISLDELKLNRYRIVTSMNEDAQQIAFDQFQQDGYFPGNDKETVEGTFVMMDQETGSIVAALGGRHFKTLELNRVYAAKRQPGSTMKPLAVYAPALETEKFNPYSTLPDELKEWDGKEIRNHNNQYDGSVTLYNAIKYSKNTSSVWLLNEIGVDYAKTYLEKMDMKIEDKDLGIALGALTDGLTPIQLVEGFRTFIHSGEMIDAHAIKEIHNQKGDVVATAQPKTSKVFSPQVAWNMTEMLKGVVESGTGSSGYYPHELAGKTGTTQHPNVEGQTKDAWFVGMTPEYVTALWMGYDKSDKDHYLTGGSSYPTELTKKILTELDKRQSLETTFVKPDNVVALEEPIELPKIDDLSSSYIFGGVKLLKGKLEWTKAKDERIVYRIYEEKKDGDERIGEVSGTNEFIVEDFSIFKTNSYYVVPYDPLGQVEGNASNVVKLTF